MTAGPIRRFTARILLPVTAVMLLSPATFAGNSGAFRGRVLHGDGVTPHEGVTVRLIDPRTEQDFPSTPTSEDGGFSIEEAPTGEYRVLVETPEGAYLTSNSVRLQSGENRPVTLALNTFGPDYQTQQGLGGGGSGLGTITKWIIVGVIVVGALFVIDELTEDNEVDASPFYAP